MELNKSTAMTLKAGIWIGLALMAVGLVMSMADMGQTVLWWGMLVLIASPFVSVVVSFVCLLRDKDRFWPMIAALLLVITAAGVVVSVL